MVRHRLSGQAMVPMVMMVRMVMVVMLRLMRSGGRGSRLMMVSGRMVSGRGRPV